MDLFQVLAAKLTAVLRTLHGLEQCAGASRDQADHQPGVYAIGRGALRRVEDAQPPGGACAHVDQPAALTELLIDHVHRLSDLRCDLRHGLGDLMVFLVDELHHVQRGHAVDVHGALIALLSVDLF